MDSFCGVFFTHVARYFAIEFGSEFPVNGVECGWENLVDRLFFGICDTMNMGTVAFSEIFADGETVA